MAISNEDLKQRCTCELEVFSLNYFMVAHRGNQTQIAKELGVNRGTVRKWIDCEWDVLITENENPEKGESKWKVYPIKMPGNIDAFLNRR